MQDFLTVILIYVAVITVLAGGNMDLIQFVGSWKCENKEK
jgi:hypothetical protein